MRQASFIWNYAQHWQACSQACDTNAQLEHVARGQSMSQVGAGGVPLRAQEGWSMRATLSMRVGSSAIRLTLLNSRPAECMATSACTAVTNH